MAQYTIVVNIYTTPKRTKVQTVLHTFDAIEEARLYGAGVMTAALVLDKPADYCIVENGWGIVEKGNDAVALRNAATAPA